MIRTVELAEAARVMHVTVDDAHHATGIIDWCHRSNIDPGDFMRYTEATAQTYLYRARMQGVTLEPVIQSTFISGLILGWILALQNAPVLDVPDEGPK